MSTSTGPDLQLRFRRFECKYLVSEAQVARINRLVSPYVERDPFAARQPDGRYPLSSLYLDSSGLRLYRETVGGIRNRFKLRIRAYSDRFEDPVFFEVKSRRDRVIEKERARVRRGDMLAFIESGAHPRVPMPVEERQHLESFIAKMRAIDARPRLLVRYSREAFVAKYDSTVRVTFDRELRAMEHSRPGQFFSGDSWNTVEGGRVIVEFKFNDHCPGWMAQTIRSEGLERISYSKYANSIRSCGEARAMSTSL